MYQDDYFCIIFDHFWVIFDYFWVIFDYFWVIFDYFWVIFDYFCIKRQILWYLGQLKKNWLELNFEPQYANLANLNRWNTLYKECFSVDSTVLTFILIFCKGFEKATKLSGFKKISKTEIIFHKWPKKLLWLYVRLFSKSYNKVF
jgi:hypothetical protein